MMPHLCSAWRKPLTSFILLLVVATALAAGGCGGKTSRTRSESSLPEKDRTMLAEYETLRASLAQDDFRTTKRAAAKFQQALEAATPPDTSSPVYESVTKIANAAGLEPQREAFRTWSKQAIELTKDVQGFYVIHCPLPNCGDWLQKDTKVDNPYMGKSMRDCGEVQK